MKPRDLSFELTPRDEGKPIYLVLMAKQGLSAKESRQLVESGAVRIAGQRVKKAEQRVRVGQQVVVVIEERGAEVPGSSRLRPDQILLEDEHLIAVNKPAGVAAHGTPGSDEGHLLALVSAHLGRTAGLVHRLDRETTGVTVFGKTHAATVALTAAFEAGAARKRYVAAVVGSLPDEGRIDLAISPDSRRWGKFRALQGGKLSAVTRYRVIARRGPLCAVEVFPETGRTHQIRVHMRALGAPLAGDTLYGGPTEVDTPLGRMKVARVMLHARALELPHPATGALIRIEAPVPEDLRALLTAAGAGPTDL